jgi:hypothetical protein
MCGSHTVFASLRGNPFIILVKPQPTDLFCKYPRLTCYIIEAVDNEIVTRPRLYYNFLYYTFRRYSGQNE